MTKKNPVLLARQRERALALKISELLKKEKTEEPIAESTAEEPQSESQE